MTIRSPFHRALVPAALILLAVSFSAQSRNLYRYHNDEGNVVVDFQVPAEYVSRGYEVINSKGVVIKVVPRELTEEEKQSQDAQARLEAEAKAEQKRLREWDESLLLRYSTVADIEATRDRALQDLRIRVSILKSNRRSLKTQVENYQAEAADMERRGQEVDQDRLQAIADLQEEIAITERSIVDREQQIDAVEAAYGRDIERFEMLLEIVELRRSLLAQEREAREGRNTDPRR